MRSLRERERERERETERSADRPIFCDSRAPISLHLIDPRLREVNFASYFAGFGAVSWFPFALFVPLCVRVFRLLGLKIGVQINSRGVYVCMCFWIVIIIIIMCFGFREENGNNRRMCVCVSEGDS